VGQLIEGLWRDERSDWHLADGRFVRADFARIEKLVRMAGITPE